MVKPTATRAAVAAPADTMEKLTLELRRGVIILACLSQLDQPGYGYELQQRLAELGMEIEQGTLYPLLIRLEGQGYLEAEWQQPAETGRPPRHAYRLTAAGRALARGNPPPAPDGHAAGLRQKHA